MVCQVFRKFHQFHRLIGSQPFIQGFNNLFVYGGEGVEKDAELSLPWFRSAAEQGLPAAQYWLATMFANGEGVTLDYVEAHMWTGLAAKRASGDIKAEYQATLQLIEAEMTTDQIAEALRRAQEWQPRPTESTISSYRYE